MSSPTRESGLFASLTRLLATALEMAQVRLDLLGTEVELEKRRIFEVLVLGACALFILGVGVVLACAFIILMFWDGYRLAAVGVLAASCLVGGIFLIQKLRQRLCNSKGMFHASLAELQRDQADLKASDPHAQR